MNPIKIAVLEDDQRFLKDLIESLKKTKLVDDKNIIYNQNSDDFIEEVLKNDIDVLLLDIKLEGDIRNGIDVANILKKPTIFFTSARNEYTDKIEALKTSKEFPPVEEFNKSPDVERLKTILEKFIPRVRDYQKENVNTNLGNSLYIKTHSAKLEKILFSKIVLILTCESESRDKLIYTNDLTEIKAKNITLDELLFKLSSSFIKINSSAIINIECEFKLIDRDTIRVKPIDKVVNISDKYSENFFKVFPKFKI